MFEEERGTNDRNNSRANTTTNVLLVCLPSCLSSTPLPGHPSDFSFHRPGKSHRFLAYYLTLPLTPFHDRSSLLCMQVFVPLIAHCVRPQVSEDRPGGHPGLGLQSAMALKSLAEGEHDGINAALTALLTPGGLAVLRRSPEELVRALRLPVLLETPKLIWSPKCREELEELLKQVVRF